MYIIQLFINTLYGYYSYHLKMCKLKWCKFSSQFFLFLICLSTFRQSSRPPTSSVSGSRKHVSRKATLPKSKYLYSNGTSNASARIASPPFPIQLAPTSNTIASKRNGSSERPPPFCDKDTRLCSNNTYTSKPPHSG